MEDNKYQQIVIRVSIITIILNLGLSIFKLITGYITKSNAMISDGVHSASDVVSTIIVMIGVKLAKKEPDKEHPYGHERIESIASLLLAILLILVGMMIGMNGMYELFEPTATATVSKQPALWAAILSIIIKEGMYWYTKKYAKQIHSDALMADAWHHRSDALSSIGSCIGVVGYLLGYPVWDTIACIVICLCIIKVGIDIGKDAICKVIDCACDEETIQAIQQIVYQNKEVKGIQELKTRLFGNKIYMEIQILVEGNKLLEEAYQIEKKVHHAIEEEIPQIKYCQISMKPIHN